MNTNSPSEKYPCACPAGACGRLERHPNQYCREQSAKALPSKQESLADLVREAIDHMGSWEYDDLRNWRLRAEAVLASETGCRIHGECPICKAERALGDPRVGVSLETTAPQWQVLCANPVMTSPTSYTGCKLPDGHEGDCSPKATELPHPADDAEFGMSEHRHPPCVFRSGCKYQPHCADLCQGPPAAP